MYKVPARHKRTITQELKKFVPLVTSLQARGKSSTEEDARILLNDIFHNVLGYDKYNDLRTEMRDRNGRIDYVVKLSDGPYKNKQDKFDFVVEAKAAYVELNQHTIDQTLSYCLTSGTDYFLLTNAVKWQLFKVKRNGKTPTAIILHEVNLGVSNDYDSLAEQFYLFSKISYLNNDWKSVTNIVKATKVEDVVAVILSDKIIKAITKELSNLHDLKVSEDAVKDIVENQIVKAEVSDVNTRLMKKLNTKTVKSKPKQDDDQKNISPEASCSDEESIIEPEQDVA